MKINYLIRPILFFFFFLIKEVKLFKEEILDKYGSIKTGYSSMIINSSEFYLTDDIYLTLGTNSKCDEYIKYQFYDEIRSIYNQTSDLKYNIKAHSKVWMDLIGLRMYYKINKNKGILGDLKGNILYIEFKCEGKVTITNERDDPSKIFIYIGISIVLFFVIIICFLMTKGCLFWIFICFNCFCKKRNRYDIDSLPGLDTISNEEISLQNSPNRIIYVYQGQNEINYNNINNPNFNPNNLSSDKNNLSLRQQNLEKSSNIENINSSE